MTRHRTQFPANPRPAGRSLLCGAWTAAALAASAALTCAATPVWEEDFSGINGPVQDTERWTGVQGLPNNGSLRNHHIRASDDPFDFGGPAAHKFVDGFYSGGGAVYAAIPTSPRYEVRGSLVDFGTGADRNSNTSFYVEAGIDTNDHTLDRDGWEFRIVRWDNGNENTVHVHDPFGNRLINHYLGSAPTEPMVVPFEFHRDGDDVTLVVHDGEERLEATASLPLDPDTGYVLLRHFIYGFGSDSTQFGWADLQVFDLDDAPASFDAWLAEHFTAEERDDPEISGEHAAPAGDGVPNLLKYALGLDPRSPAGPGELPALTVDGEHLGLVYQPDADAPDVALVPEVSDNLLDWESGDGFVEVVEETVNGATVVHARSVERIADRSSLFIRLRAVREP